MKSTIHTKVFWIAAIAVGLVTLLLCLYPYLWIVQNRSGQPKESIK